MRENRPSGLEGGVAGNGHPYPYDGTDGKMGKCQGTHGRCRASYRCCIPALAGFASLHSMDPGARSKRARGGVRKSRFPVGNFLTARRAVP